MFIRQLYYKLKKKTQRTCTITMTITKQCGGGTPVREFDFKLIFIWYSGKSNRILHTDIQLVKHCGDCFITIWCTFLT